MRNPFFTLLVVCSLAAPRLSAQVLPEAAPEIPVSVPTIGPAPLEQAPSAADSNGDVALIAWDDNRSGAPVAYAARLNDTGALLDPLGIRVGEGLTRAVVWTGENFVVLLELEVLHELVYIDATGIITHRRILEVEEPFVAAIDGPHVRLLFLDAEQRVSGESFLRGWVVDPLGPVPNHGLERLPVISQIELPAAPPGLVDDEWIGASDETDLLVLRYQRRETGSSADRIAADRISSDATVVSSVDTGLAFPIDDSDELAGNMDGYVLVRRARPEAPEVRSYRLTSAGVYTGQTDILGPPLPPAFTDIRLIRDNERYIFAWWTPDSVQGVVRAYATTVSTDGQFGGPQLIGDWVGSISSSVLAAEGEHRVAFFGVRQRIGSSSYDVLASTVTDILGEVQRTLVSQSGTLQSEVRVAASDFGFIAGWAENGPDRFARAFVRRFSSGGSADDTVPRELYAIEQNANDIRLPRVRVAATRNHYVAVWAASNGLFARRIGAVGGDWLDAEPILIASGATDFDVTSNGTDALIAWTAPCAQGPHCVLSRTLTMSGAALMSTVETISAQGFNYEVTAASDGNEYLLAWSEGRRDCVVGCGFDPFSILAARVARNGTPVDRQPIVIENRRTFAEQPAIAFDGQEWVVIWSSWNQGWSTRGVRVTREGGVVEREASGDGVTVDERTAAFSTQPVLVLMGDELVLMTRHAQVIARRTEFVWSATVFPARTPLAQVRTRQRVDMFRSASERFGTVHGARSPQGLLYLGYDRVALGMYGGVPRAFVTRYGTAPSGRRRSVSH